MKQKIFIKIILFTFHFLLFTNCGKEGCTDPKAHNFDPSAIKDDGKCFYGLNESSASFTFIPTNSYELVVEYARCMHTSVVGSMHTTLVSFNIIISSFPYFYMFLRARTSIRAYVNY